ncbi:RCC1 domain-containing protein [Amnibacterium flavum]|nr:hypothetical protein [Amnibacterium flavum]
MTWSARTTKRGAAVLGAAALIVGLAGFGTVASGAWFTAKTSTTATITGATLSIGNIGASDETSITVADVFPMTDAQAPTMAPSQWVTVRNTGTISLNWTISVAGPKAVAPLTAAQLSGFKVQLYNEAGQPVSGIRTLDSFGPTAVAGDHLFWGTGLAAGASQRIGIRAWLTPESGDAFQGAKSTFDIVINAMQGEAPQPVNLPVGLSALTVTPVSTGTPSGASTRIEWSDAGAQLSARGFASAPTYTVQRSATGDFSDATTVYTGPLLTKDDTVGTGTPTGNRDASQITATSRQDATFALIGGKVYAWGSIYKADLRSAGNYWLQTGKAQEITGFPGAVTQMSAGRDHFCAVIETGQVYCAGFNGRGQLGNGSTNDALNGAVAVTDTNGVFTGKRIVQVDAGEYFTCALASDGTVGCWGDNAHKQLGSSTAGSTSNVPVVVNGTGSSTPAAVLGATPAKISAGGSFACVLAPTSAAAGKSAACWGEAGSGQLGAAMSTDSATPVLVKDTAGLLVGASQISTASGTACVITNATTAANVVCWGLNDRSLLGDGGTNSSSTPARITTSATGFDFLELGTSVACAGKASAVYCWGNDWAGQLGRGNTNDANYKPAAITDTNKALDGSSYTDVAAGWTHTCAINAAGAVACWGLSHQFQMGNDDTGTDGQGKVNGAGTTNVPVQVKLAGTNLDGQSTSLVCAAGAPKLSDSTCGLSPKVAYSYRVGYTTPDVADWSSETVTAVRR